MNNINLTSELGQKDTLFYSRVSPACDGDEAPGDETPDAAPDASMWVELGKMLEGHPAKWMIWEGEPLDKISDKLAELGLVSIVYDPCASTPREGDYLAAQHKNLAALAKVYSELP